MCTYGQSAPSEPNRTRTRNFVFTHNDTFMCLYLEIRSTDDDHVLLPVTVLFTSTNLDETVASVITRFMRLHSSGIGKLFAKQNY